MRYSISDPVVRGAVLDDLQWLASLNGYSDEAVIAVYRLLTSTLEGDKQQRDLLDAFLREKSNASLSTEFKRLRKG